MNDRQNILTAMTAAARRLLLARMVQSAVLAAAAAFFLAAAVEAAWTIAPRFPLAATLLAALPALAMTVLLRRGARTRAIWFLLAVVGLLTAAAAVWSVQGQWFAHLPRTLAIIVPLLAAAAAAIIEASRGVAPETAAALLDARHALRERLSTAVELAISPRAQTPLADFVTAQALAAWRSSGADRAWPVRPAAAAIAALATGVVLCAALAAVPAAMSDAEMARVEALARAMEQLAPLEKDQTASRLQNASAKSDAQIEQMLLDARQLLLAGDARKLADIMARLKEAGIDVDALMGPELAGAAGMTGGRGAGQSGPSLPPPAQTRPALPPAPDYVMVYDPALAEAARQGTAAAPQAPSPYVPLQTAWQAAQAQAGDRSRTDLADLPPHYRRMIQEFFSPR